MLKFTKKAFTLVELIIVVTIIAILATIWFISYSGYSENLKDTVRKTDVKTISKALEFKLSKGLLLPAPDNISWEITEKWVKFKIGELWDQSHTELESDLAQLPIDPVDKTHYKYAISENWRYYIVVATLNNWQEYKYSNLVLADNSSKNNWENKQNGKQENPQNKQETPKNPENEEDEWIFTYDEFDKKIVITWFKPGKARKEITIPKKIKQKDVLEIWNDAFHPYDIEKVDAPSVEVIWNQAFKFGKLKEIKFPNVKFIWNETFRNNPGLTKIDFPSVEYIWNNAFSDIWLVTELNIPNVKTIWDHAFLTTSLNKSSKVRLEKVESIWIRAFDGMNLEEIDLPKVKTIWDSAFANNWLKKVNLPEVVSIWNDAFYGDNVKEVKMQKVKTIWKTAFYYNKIEKLELPEVTDIWENAFGYNALEEIKLKNVINIWDAAFLGNSLKEIYLPKVKNVWENTFNGNLLKKIELPEVKFIWKRAFTMNFWNWITDIKFPKVEVISEWAFSDNTTWPKKLVLPSSLKKIEVNAFSNTLVEEIDNKSNLTEAEIKPAFGPDMYNKYTWKK